MEHQSPTSNWQESPAHYNLLRTFEKPRDIKQVLEWQWPRDELREKPEIAIERFIREGMLVPASLGEGLNKLFQVAQLKKLLAERSLPTSGNKADLIERLIAHDGTGMAEIVGNTIVKCSDVALNLLAKKDQEIEENSNLAKHQSFEAFKGNNPKQACKIYETFRRGTIDSTYKISTYDVDELQFILTSHPKVLSGLSAENLKALQLAACMKTLWKREVVEKWLPDSFSSPFKDSQIPANYLMRHAEFQRQLSDFRQFSKQVKISFDSGDIDSCDLCMALDGKAFDIADFPELPIPGCASDTGCMGRLDWTGINDDDEDFEDDDDEHEVVYSTELSEENTIGTLRVLKQMLDEGLITQEEYDDKKKEILSRL